MDTLVLKQLPENMSNFAVDLENPNRVLINGCFQENVIVNGTKRQFITYIPESMDNCQPCIVLAPPAKADGLETLINCGFKRLADEKKLFVFLLVPDQKEWDLSGADADYMNAVYVAVQARDYYVTMQDNIYACGLADGADVAQQAAQRMTSEWSGLFTIGELSVNIAENMTSFATARKMEDAELYVSATKSQLPVWMAFNTFNSISTSVVEYWKEQNQVSPEPLCGQGADYIWMPAFARQNAEVDEEKISQVRISLNKTRPTYELVDTMWNYIGLARRHRGQGQKNLRYFKDPIMCGATLHTRNIEGMKRIWYEYVPECCTSDKKWPLVVVLHGRGGTAETFFDISNMFHVANRRQFIAIFPQAGLHQQKKNGLKNVLHWNGELDGKPINDVEFIRNIIQDIVDRLPVDKSRIYACGQSSGGMMADALCECASEIFAATASWSAIMMPSKVSVQLEKTEPLTPTMFIYGDQDSLSAGNEPDPELPMSLTPEVRNGLMKKLERYGLDKDDVQVWHNHPITWYSFPNKQGVPMLTVGVVNDMVHANYPEESWISYDQFFCQFCRDHDGRLCYRGKLVE